MEFLIIHKESFDLDYSKLNRDMQRRIVRHVLPELRKRPHVRRGDTIRPLDGFERIWRYRIGGYRLIYAVYPEKHLVQLLMIGPRKDVYGRFTVRPEEQDFQAYAKAIEDALNPDTPAPERLIPFLHPKKPSGRELPILLTRPQLRDWGLPEETWGYFESCRTEEDLLNCDAPEEYKLYVMEQMWPTPIEHVAQQPNMVLHGLDDLVRYAEGDVVYFLLYLDEEQRRFVNWGLQGPTLLKGGPGSGKSTVALYRVQQLLDHVPPGTGRVLFVTYTNALINASKELLTKLLGKRVNEVDISTLDKIARGIVYEKMGHYQEMASSREIRDTIEVYQKKFPILNGLSPYYLQEEIRWVIEGRGFQRKVDYLNAQRPGRKIPLSVPKREAVWRLYQMLKAELRAREKITWGDLRLHALRIVREKKGKFPKWDFVVIDEAQDLTPVALALAVELCKSPQGVFLTADASQSIYNKGFAWKNVHSSLNVRGRTRLLRRNYRTTRQIAEAAHNFVRGTGVADEEALKQEYVRVGPKPSIFKGQNADAMFRWLAISIKAACHDLRLPSNAAVVLTRTNDLAKEAAAQLTAHGLLAKYVSGRDLNLQESGTKVMTIHSAKGLEFPIVALPYFEDGVFPLPREGATSAEMQELENQELRLLYVAWTRAMYRLFVTYHEGKASPFLSLVDLSLWDVVTGY